MRKSFKSFEEYKVFANKFEYSIPYNTVCFVDRENEKADVCWYGEFDTPSTKIAMQRFFKDCPELIRELFEGIENVIDKDEVNRFSFNVEKVSKDVVYIGFATNRPELWTKKDAD